MRKFESCYFSKINLTLNYMTNLTFNASKFALFYAIHFLFPFEQLFYLHLLFAITSSPTKNSRVGLLRWSSALSGGGTDRRVQSKGGCLQGMGPAGECGPGVVMFIAAGTPGAGEPERL